jgi:hypothetical protein
MGWIAITKDYQVLREGEHGRPVEAGNEGNLLFIMQEDFGHRVAVDLVNGAIIVEYNDWIVENNDIQIINPGFVFRICDETSIVGEIKDVVKLSEPDADGWYTQEFIDLEWRPIWFTRVTNGDPTKVIGAQTTLPEQYGGKNVKKMVSLFSTGVVGID